MDNIYAIIPVSKFKNAKTRLSPFLSEEEREKLQKLKGDRQIQQEKIKELSEIEQKIIEHFRNPNNIHGSVAPFCRENKISFATLLLLLIFN